LEQSGVLDRETIFVELVGVAVGGGGDAGAFGFARLLLGIEGA